MKMSDEIKTKKVVIIYTLNVEDYIDFVSPIDNPNLHKIKAEAEAAAIQKIKDKFTKNIDTTVVWGLVAIIGLIVIAFIAKILLAPSPAPAPSAVQTMTSAIQSATPHMTVLTKTVTEAVGTSTTTYTTLITTIIP
jgi:hypothetical protein